MYRLYRILSNRNVMDGDSSSDDVYIPLQHGLYWGKVCGN